MKKINLPPTNLKGIETYLRRKGYRISPILEDSVRGALLTFDKPLPDGRRLHGSVHKSRKGFRISQHIDSSDPYRDPLGHLVKDYGAKHRRTSSTVRKRTTRRPRKRTTRRPRKRKVVI